MLRSLVLGGRRSGAAAASSTAMLIGRADPSLGRGFVLTPGQEPSLPPSCISHSLGPTRHFLDIYQVINKAAIEKERERLSDELNRGYFADIQEFSKHGGKIAAANKTIIPAMAAMKFPDLEANFSDGRRIKLPNVSTEGEKDDDNPRATLLCLSFRASSQVSCTTGMIYLSSLVIFVSTPQMMIESWSEGFVNACSSSGNARIYEVSLIDSWFLSRSLVKRVMLRVMKKSECPQRQRVYAFGDHYELRKKLKILNLLSGYIFLLDRFGRIRWQGFGSATPEELASLVACTSHLVEEK